jgi:hypothetical protein
LPLSRLLRRRYIFDFTLSRSFRQIAGFSPFRHADISAAFAMFISSSFYFADAIFRLGLLFSHYFDTT